MEETLQTESTLEEVNELENTQKYLLNVVYFSPKQSQVNGPVVLDLEVKQLFFEKYKKAIEEFKSISRTKVIEVPTLVGKIIYNVISIEMIDLKKYSDIIINQAKKEAEEKLRDSEKIEEEVGEIENNGTGEN